MKIKKGELVLVPFPFTDLSSTKNRHALVLLESDEDKPGIIIDYDKKGGIVGIELLEASSKMKKPGSLVYEVN